MPGATDTHFRRKTPAGTSRWELLLAGRLFVLDLVHGLAQLGQLPVHLPPGTVGVSQRFVLSQAVPRVITQHIRERELLIGVETLSGKPQPGYWDIGGHILRPLDRSVLDRHPEWVGLYLHHEVEGPFPRVKRSDHGVPQVVL